MRTATLGILGLLFLVGLGRVELAFGPRTLNRRTSQQTIVGAVEVSETPDSIRVPDDDSQKEVKQAEICQASVLRRFNLPVDNNVAPRVATEDELNYCYNNRRSCCTVDQIRAAGSHLSKANKKYMRMMDFLEELLSAFVGRKIYQFVERLSESQKCLSRQRSAGNFHDIGFSLSHDCNPEDLRTKYFDFIWLYKCKRLDIINDRARELLEEFPRYSRNMRYFYGNLICSVCDPRENAMFRKTDDGTGHLKISIESLNQMLRNQLFEHEVRDFVVRVARAMANYIYCHEEQNEKKLVKNFSEEKEKDPEPPERLAQMNECLLNTRKAELKCADLLKSNLTNFGFHYLDIRNIKEILDSFYFLLNGHSIQKYYKRVKNSIFLFREGKHDQIKQDEVFNDDVTEVVFFPKVEASDDTWENLVYEMREDGANPFYSFFTKSVWTEDWTQPKIEAV
jgi:hypothetical protein